MRTYKYSQPGQQIAFGDSLIVPTFELTTRQDTTWKDSLTIDTIKTVPYTHFLPDDIALRLVKEKAERQYMLRPERNDEKILTLRFNASVDSLPALTPVNFTPSEENWYYLQAEDEQIVKATCEYGTTIHASVEEGNVFACQFHPEKSSRFGLQILKNFAAIGREEK